MLADDKFYRRNNLFLISKLTSIIVRNKLPELQLLFSYIFIGATYLDHLEIETIS